MQITNPVSGVLRFRAAASAYRLLMGLAGIPTWVALVSLSTPGATSFLLLGLGAMAVVFLWLRRFTIEVTRDAITYRTLWSGTRTLRFTDIRKAAVEMGDVHEGFHTRPMIRLALYPYEGSGEERLDINMKVFEREDIQLLQSLLGLDPDELSIVRRLRRSADRSDQ